MGLKSVMAGGDRSQRRFSRPSSQQLPATTANTATGCITSTERSQTDYADFSTNLRNLWLILGEIRAGLVTIDDPVSIDDPIAVDDPVTEDDPVTINDPVDEDDSVAVDNPVSD